jgi:DNA-directed RNA polymerase III subunit RPC6
MEQHPVDPDPINAEQRILELCAQHPDGINDLILQTQMPQVTPQQRLAALNRLLSLNRLDLLKSAQLGVVYRLRDPHLDPAALHTAHGAAHSGADMDEKLVYAVIKESGNKGIWIRDISTKTNVKSTALNKALKSLESKKLIKSVQSVNASKKKVYMLFDLEPDRSITGGAWYSGKEFESEFVEILNEQCYHYLCEKREQLAGNAKYADPVLRRNALFATSKEIRDYIKSLGISKVDLSVEDIESILNTLVYDGKCEKSVMASSLSMSVTAVEHIHLYRAVGSLLDPKTGSGIVRTPCGICPLFDNCHPDGLINPKQCVYMKEWLEF